MTSEPHMIRVQAYIYEWGKTVDIDWCPETRRILDKYPTFDGIYQVAGVRTIPKLRRYMHDRREPTLPRHLVVV